MNYELLFEDTLTPLLAQGCKSKKADGDGFCVYRGHNGTKCAIGFIIPDELYDTAMEGKRAFVLYRNYPALRDYWDDRYSIQPSEIEGFEEILKNIQWIHDGHDPIDWARSAEVVRNGGSL